MSWISVGVAFVALLCTQTLSGGRSLTVKEVNLLVANIPEALAVKRNGGCPTPDYSELSSDLAMVQLRNTCPRSGGGFIGNYVVDLHSGKIWSDVDRKKEVDSTHLRALRKKLVSK